MIQERKMLFTEKNWFLFKVATIITTAILMFNIPVLS